MYNSIAECVGIPLNDNKFLIFRDFLADKDEGYCTLQMAGNKGILEKYEMDSDVNLGYSTHVCLRFN